MTSPSQATYSGDFDTSLHNFKFGFWLDYPISESLFTSLSVGYASIYAHTEFNYTETQTFPGVTINRTLSGRDEWKPGFYAQWRLAYQASKRVNAFLGVDYQWNDKVSFNEADRNVTLDFSDFFGATAGVQVNF